MSQKSWPMKLDLFHARRLLSTTQSKLISLAILTKTGNRGQLETAFIARDQTRDRWCCRRTKVIEHDDTAAEPALIGDKGADRQRA
jgi:hypothetical protein